MNYRSQNISNTISETQGSTPKDAESWFQLGIRFHKQGQFSKAIQAYERSLEIDSNHTQAKLAIVLVLIDTSNYEEANKRFTTLQLSPNNAITSQTIARHHFEIGSIYNLEGKTQKATHSFNKSLEIWPQNIPCRLQLSRIYIQDKNYQKAVEHLQNVLNLDPKNDEALSLLGLVKHLQGQGKAAERHWMQARRLNLSNSTARTFLHAIHQKK